jgi:hypothetical protein
MATAHNTPHASDPEVHETQVRLTLAAEDEWTEEALERDAVSMLAAVEREVSGILGPVVAWNIERGEIELEFTIPSTSGAAVHERAAALMQVVERKLPLLREVESHTATGALAGA